MQIVVRSLLFAAFVLVLCTATVQADCCVCIGCPGSNSLDCRTPSQGCDVSDCDLICSGCSSFEGVADQSCAEVRGCNEALAPFSAVPAVGPSGKAVIGLLLLGIGFFGISRSPRVVRGAAVIAVFFGSVMLVQAVGSVVLSGTWSSSAPNSENSASQAWTITLTDTHSDSLAGTVTISGSTGGGGTFRGTRQGDQVSGTITDDSGGVVAEVAAVLSDAGLAGTYRTPGGDSGTFTAELISG